MSIIRVRRPRGYTVIPDTTLRDTRLSLSALGLLVRLLSRPDGWEVRPPALARECGVGRDALRAILRALQETGYLVRRRHRDAVGRWDWESEIYDTPRSSIDGLSGDGESAAGEPDNGASSAGVSGDLSNTDLSTTESSTTTTEVVGGGHMSSTADLQWPRLHAEDQAIGEQILASCSHERRQEVLDVLAAAIQDRKIARSSPIPYLSALAAAASCAPGARKWDPSPGYPIARKRKDREQEALRTAERTAARKSEDERREARLREGSPIAEAALSALPPSVRPRRLANDSDSNPKSLGGKP